MITSNDIEILVASDAAIEGWTQRRNVIPSEISGWAAERVSQEQQAAALLPTINALSSQISQLDLQISALESSISELRSTLWRMEERRREQQENPEHHGHHHHNHHEENRIKGEISAIELALVMPVQQRGNLASERRAFRDARDAHLSRADDANNHIIRLQKEDAKLLQSINKSHAFLQQLQNSPEVLCNNLAASLRQQLVYHEENFPHQQSIAVRIALRTLTAKLDCILGARIREDQNATREWQIKYAILCSLVWQMAASLNQEASLNQAFFSWLRALMQDQVHISERGDLPDRVGPTQVSCYQLYQTLKTNHREALHDMTYQELGALELKAYQDAHKEFAVTLGSKDKPRVPKKVHEIGMDALKNAEKLRLDKEQTPDLKFYTTALTHLNKTVKDPQDMHIRKCTELSNVAHGARTCERVFWGSLLLFAATVVTTLSLFAAIASFGASAPASALGVALGTSLAVKALSIITFGAGVAAGVASYGLFKRRGLSKNLHDITTVPRPWPITEPGRVEPSAPPRGLRFCVA